MRKIIVGIVTLIMLTTGLALAVQLHSVKSKHSTSEDIPLTFILEKTTWDGDDINLWGYVKNTGKTSYRSVKVIFIVRDAKGDFIGRTSWHTDPSDIGPGQVGYIDDKHVRCEGRRPALVEFSVIGEN